MRQKRLALAGALILMACWGVLLTVYRWHTPPEAHIDVFGNLVLCPLVAIALAIYSTCGVRTEEEHIRGRSDDKLPPDATVEAMREREYWRSRALSLAKVTEDMSGQINCLKAEVEKVLQPFARVWNSRPTLDVTKPFTVTVNINEYGAFADAAGLYKRLTTKEPK